jgi:hypothetical protein
MSRFKLFGILQAMAVAIMGNKDMNPHQKSKEVTDINRRGGGMLFDGSPYGPKQLNQRQKRKRWAQGELTEGIKINCYCCGKNLNDKTPEEIFIDPFFWNVLAVVFCTEQCRNDYVDSK